MKIKSAALALAIALASALSACETATPYQPLRKGTAVSGGFTDQKLDTDRFRVIFQGNDLTSRQVVENYLLYRAAELTIAQGYDWFETDDRHTEADRRTYIDPFYGPGGYGYGYGFGWRPSWRYYGGFGWGGWGAYGGWGGAVETVKKFEASAEIVMGRGAKPGVRALDAREVMTNLGPKIILPTTK
jgi:hypothetical protein